MVLTWIISALRAVALWIDQIIYWAVTMVYELFIMISETGIFTQETIQTFAGRIYALLGIFMLFKVSFSLITYILNPDELTDKTKGASKLLMNFFVVLIGIILVPYVFKAAFSLQRIILKDNIIGNLVLGLDYTNGTDQKNPGEYVEEGGQRMAYTVFSAFFRPNEVLVGRECSMAPITVTGDSNGNRTASLSEACTNSENSAVFELVLNDGSSVRQALEKAYDQNNRHYLMDTGLVNLRYQDEYVIDYSAIISTLGGAFLAWILLIFCIDIAVRSVKLGFLQIVAPIPIISYIDPKSGKDGMFQKWLKNCISTYLSLFIRLIAIYFAIFIISALTNGQLINVVSNEQQTNIFVVVFIIFGALLFAKQLPQLITDITGFKFPGDFTLNPMKKLGQSPFASAVIGGGVGLLGGMAANAWAATKNKDVGFMKGLGSTLGGGIGAARRGVMGGLKSDGKTSAWKTSMDAISQSSNARRARADGKGFVARFQDRLTDIAQVKFDTGTTSMTKNEINQLQQKLDNAKGTEQMIKESLGRMISDNYRQHASGLWDTFNGLNLEVDEKTGKVKGYTKLTHRDYQETVARNAAGISETDWKALSDADKLRQIDDYKASHGGDAAFISEAEFEQLNSTYQSLNRQDMIGRDLSKRIKDKQEILDNGKK